MVLSLIVFSSVVLRNSLPTLNLSLIDLFLRFKNSRLKGKLKVVVRGKVLTTKTRTLQFY